MFVLVVTRRADTGELVRQTLGAEGWWVTAVADRETAVRSASEQAPKLVVVDGQVAESAELVRDFAAGQGGPGVLLLAADEPPGAAVAAGADAVLGPCPDAETLAATVRRLLDTTSAPAADGLPTPGQVLNAQDIFGDMLVEIESDSPLSEPPPPPPPPVAVSLSAPPPEETGGPPPAPAPVDTRPLAIAGLEPLASVGFDGPGIAPDPEPEVEVPEPDPAILSSPAAEAVVADPPATEALAAEPSPPVEREAPAPVEPEPPARMEIEAEAEVEAEAEAEAEALAPLEPEVLAPVAVERAAPAAQEPGDSSPLRAPAAASGRGLRHLLTLPGGSRFWLGLAAGLLVFAAASLLLERLFPPRTAPVEVSAPAINAAELEEVVERELAEREAALRESLLEEERRLQAEVEELAELPR